MFFRVIRHVFVICSSVMFSSHAGVGVGVDEVSGVLRGSERYHQYRLASKYLGGAIPESGRNVEVRLWDGTRVDLLSDEYAIEIDFARGGKHFEAVGQSLYYGLVTGRKPGIILLMGSGDERFVYRTQVVCARYGISLWVERI